MAPFERPLVADENLFTQAVAACFAAGFLLNPICLVFGMDAQVPVEVFLVIIGIGWSWLSTRHMKPLTIRRYAPRGELGRAGFDEDGPDRLWAHLAHRFGLYRGDEVFHIISVQNALAHVADFSLTASRAALVDHRVGGRQSLTIKAGPRPVWIGAIPLLIVAAICVPSQIPASLLQHPYLRDRLLRYPCLAILDFGFARSSFGFPIGAALFSQPNSVVFCPCWP